MKLHQVARAVAFCLSATPLLGWSAEPAADSANVVQAVTMVVRATLNTEDKGDIFVGRTSDQDFLVKLEDLKAMGFKDPAGTLHTFDGQPHLSLRSMKGVTVALDEKTLSLNISADPQLLERNQFDLRGPRKIRSLAPAGGSAFFNYALSYANNGLGSGLAAEAGWRQGNFLLLSDANTVEDAEGRRKLVRLTSSLTHENREALRRTVIGDFFTQARDLGTGVTLGGISITKVFGLDPYLIRFPLQNVTGTVALPSDLEVYLDGQKIRTERLKPGEFELRDILAYGGARNVQLLLRDSFGRVQHLDYSFYFSDQPLRRGLHEYSYNAGAFRRDYGIQSNHYGPAAFAVFHRYGFTDAITLGLRADGSKDFLNGGPIATVVLGSAGVLNAALALSKLGQQTGTAGAVNYNYRANTWSFGLSLRRDTPAYAVLSDPPTMSNRKYEGNVTMGLALPGNVGSVSLSHSLLKTRGTVPPAAPTAPQPFSVSNMEDRRVTALGYTTTIVPGRVYLTSSLSHIKDKAVRNEFFVGLNFVLGKDYSATANARGDRQSHTASVQLTKTQPVGEGLGYTVSADYAQAPAGHSAQLGSTIQYNAPAAILRGEYGRRSASGVLVDDIRLSAAGGLAYVGEEVVVGRPITGSFGIVKVGEVANVLVSVNGQEIGKTNANGKIFVPMLSPDLDNDISISPESIPMDYSFPTTRKQVAPPSRSGILIDFAVAKLQAFIGTLVTEGATGTRPVAVALKEFSFSVDSKRQTFQTGAGGEFYLENVKPGTYAASSLVDGRPCLFTLVIPRSAEMFVELGTLTCRKDPT